MVKVLTVWLIFFLRVTICYCFESHLNQMINNTVNDKNDYNYFHLYFFIFGWFYECWGLYLNLKESQLSLVSGKVIFVKLILVFDIFTSLVTYVSQMFKLLWHCAAHLAVNMFREGYSLISMYLLFGQLSAKGIACQKQDKPTYTNVIFNKI